MARQHAPRWPIAPPDERECVALVVAARYLDRAGTTAASRLLGESLDWGERALLEALRDSLLAGAALCKDLVGNDPTHPA